MHDPSGSPSKTRRKKEASAVQELGTLLTSVKPAVLARVPLGESTRDAIVAFGRTKTYEAKRRQLQRIGRLMREEDEIAVRIALADLDALDPKEIRHLRQVQLWQHRLLEEREAGLTKLTESQRGLAPGLHARLAALIEAHAEGDEVAALEVFRMLHGQLRF